MIPDRMGKDHLGADQRKVKEVKEDEKEIKVKELSVKLPKTSELACL